jgi:uncharacterized membrane protein
LDKPIRENYLCIFIVITYFILFKEMQENTFNTDSFSSLPFYLGYFVLFFGVLWILHTYFVPYYKTHLKSKVREWIVLSHLDSSGQQIQNYIRDDSDSSYQLLDHIEILENIFGL